MFREVGKMKRFIMLIALLLSMAFLVACAGAAPRPVIIQDGKVINEPDGLGTTLQKILG